MVQCCLFPVCSCPVTVTHREPRALGNGCQRCVVQRRNTIWMIIRKCPTVNSLPSSLHHGRSNHSGLRQSQDDRGVQCVPSIYQFANLHGNPLAACPGIHYSISYSLQTACVMKSMSPSLYSFVAEMIFITVTEIR